MGVAPTVKWGWGITWSLNISEVGGSHGVRLLINTTDYMGSKPYRSRGVTWGLNLSGFLPASHIIKASVDEALTATFLLFLFLPS